MSVTASASVNSNPLAKFKTAPSVVSNLTPELLKARSNGSLPLGEKLDRVEQIDSDSVLDAMGADEPSIDFELGIPSSMLANIDEDDVEEGWLVQKTFRKLQKEKDKRKVTSASRAEDMWKHIEGLVKSHPRMRLVDAYAEAKRRYQ